MSSSPPCDTSAPSLFVDNLAVAAGLTFGVVAPFALLSVGAWVLDEIEKRRRDRGIAIQIQADGADGYHVAVLKPGESSPLPPNLLADLAKAKGGKVGRFGTPGYWG